MKTYKDLTTNIDNLYVRFLQNALMTTKGNTTQAAKLVELDRSNFLRMCRRHKIQPASYRG